LHFKLSIEHLSNEPSDFPYSMSAAALPKKARPTD